MADDPETYLPVITAITSGCSSGPSKVSEEALRDLSRGAHRDAQTEDEGGPQYQAK